VQFNPPDIRRKTFQLVRRGFDPQEVGAYLEQLSAHVADVQQRLGQAESQISGMEKDLRDAKSAEEAVRLTMMAATQAKEEILAAAQQEAADLRAQVTAQTEGLHRSAREESEKVLNEARTEALSTLESSRKDAEEMVMAAREESASIVSETAMLRQAMDAARSTLSSLANGALAELAGVEATFDSIPNLVSHEGRPAMTVVPPLDEDGDGSGGAIPTAEELMAAALQTTEGGEVVLLPDAVDRLLTQLRNINS
jgi:DivIVA domain-containing protein